MFKKQTTFLLILFFIFFSFDFTFALTKSQTAAILSKFNQKEKELLFETQIDFGDFSAGDFFNSNKKINIYDNIRKKVGTNKENIEKQRKKVLENILDLEKSVKGFEDEIKQIEKDILKINTETVTIKEKIRSNKNKIEILSKRVKETTKVLLEYTVYLYKKGNLILQDGKIDNLKAIIMSGENLDEILNDMYYKEVIGIAGRELIKKHNRYIFSLYSEKQDLEESTKRLKKLREDIIIKKKILEDKKKYKEKLLIASKGKNSLYLKYIKDKIDIERKLKIKAFKEKLRFDNLSKSILGRYGCKFVDISKNTRDLRNLTPKCLELNKIIFAESQLKNFNSSTQNIFNWPVVPGSGISAYYKDAGYKKDFGEEHYAIDIIAKQGTPIIAPADGYVLAIKEPKGQDYAFLGLKHANGFVTVYGHVNEILVGKSDFVKAGDIIGKTGGEPGTKGAGIVTTGPHLHFEVLKDENHRDPLEFLNISILEFSDLDVNYRFKYYADYKEKTGFEYAGKYLNKRPNVFRLEGNTEIERQKYLLKNYATISFNNWDMWIEESLNWNLDPTFMMCIGLAESGLGRNLKTPYNVGNIGNTDSGGTWDFQNPRQGIYWMGKTLNNSYLGKYDKLLNLSRYGNKTGAIYASSPDHWHNNIVKCMSAIKGRYIPDDYNFRIN